MKEVFKASAFCIFLIAEAPKNRRFFKAYCLLLPVGLVVQQKDATVALSRPGCDSRRVHEVIPNPSAARLLAQEKGE